MTTTINASTSSGLVVTPDNSGTIQLQSNGVTKATVSSAGFSYPGAVLQIVNNLYTTATSTSSTSFVTTGHTGSITPSSSSNKIMVFINGGTGWNGNAVNKNSFFTIYRNGSNVASDALYVTYCNAYASNSITIAYLDSPASTSSVTYTVYFKTESGGTINYVSQPSGVSAVVPASMTLMEIAG